MRSVLLILGMCIMGCPSDGAEQPTPSAAAEPAGEDAVYECPMHCKLEGRDEPYTQKEPGECPVCGMDLKPQPGQ